MVLGGQQQQVARFVHALGSPSLPVATSNQKLTLSALTGDFCQLGFQALQVRHLCGAIGVHHQQALPPGAQHARFDCRNIGGHAEA